jgi:hypothetical protein
MLAVAMDYERDKGRQVHDVQKNLDMISPVRF